MGKKDTYYRVKNYLENKFKNKLVASVYTDSRHNDSFLKGSILGDKFGLYIDDEKEIITLSYYGHNKELGRALVEKASEIFEEAPNVSYYINDIIDDTVDIKVYEWGCPLKRYNEIQDSKIVDYPRYIMNPSITFLYGNDGKVKNLRL